MITKLPRWVESGAFLLSFLAGSVNAVGFLGFQHQAISHLSGTATLMGIELITLSVSSLHLLGVLASFLLGAALSGWLIENTALRLGRHYSLALVIEGGLLLAAMASLGNSAMMGHYLASAACGLQNAMVTTYSGAIVRTTHVTGIFTDLGLMLGARLRGVPLDRRKAILFLLIITGFVIGGSVGAVLFERFRFDALLLPSTIAFALAIGYGLYLRRVAVPGQ